MIPAMSHISNILYIFGKRTGLMSTKRIITLSFSEKTLRYTERIYLSVSQCLLSVTNNLENLTALPLGEVGGAYQYIKELTAIS